MMRLRALRVVVSTEQGRAGTEIHFGSGLTVLRADNTSGKSTALQGIIFSLGLEGMMSPRKEVPFPHAMTERIELDGEEWPVIESHVVLEVENSTDEVVSLQRYAKSATFSSDLVLVLSGPVITEPGEYGREEFFVRRSGAATRTRGFHAFLENFLGWNLPPVSTYEDRETKLYLECVAPFFYVEQKYGWSGVLPRIPTYLRIRDPLQRAAEFVLNLDTLERERSIDDNLRLLTQVEAEWKSAVAELRSQAERLGAELRNATDSPTEMTPATTPSLFMVTEADAVSLEEHRSTLLKQLQAVSRRIDVEPTIAETEPKLTDELEQIQETFRGTVARLRVVQNEVVSLDAQIVSAQKRRDELEDEHQRLKDIALLRTLGADVSDALGEHLCPTCQQSLDAVESQILPILTLDDNEVLIRGQIQMVRGVERDSTRRIERLKAANVTLSEQARSQREQIRSLKSDLVAPSGFPSARDILKRAELERRIESIDRLDGQLELLVDRLHSNFAIYARLKSILEQLRAEEETSDDAEKIVNATKAFREQLGSYGLESLPIEELEISADSLRPTHEGFDLAFDLSASDGIRTKWAYLMSFLETARRFETNHPGFLILDEPRQQSTAEMSFEKLLSRASQSRDWNQQIVFATSEEPEILRQMLDGIPHTLIDLSGRKVLQLLSE